MADVGGGVVRGELTLRALRRRPAGPGSRVSSILVSLSSPCPWSASLRKSLNSNSHTNTRTLSIKYSIKYSSVVVFSQSSISKSISVRVVGVSKLLVSCAVGSKILA